MVKPENRNEGTKQCEDSGKWKPQDQERGETNTSFNLKHQIPCKGYELSLES